MFIVEGPEFSGKSYLAEKIGLAYGLPVFHTGGPPTDAGTLALRVNVQRNSFGKAVLDRCSPFSELVYGTILAGRTLVPSKDVYRWIHEFIDNDWIFIYCRPSDAVIESYRCAENTLLAKQHKDECEIAMIKDNIYALRKGYDQLVAFLRSEGMDVLTYERN